MTTTFSKYYMHIAAIYKDAHVENWKKTNYESQCEQMNINT